MDPAATTPGSARPLVASESEASIASQLLLMEGGDSEMSSLATVPEPAVQQDSQKEYTEEDLVSQILVDSDSEMADAESQEVPAMEPTNPHETPSRSNQDDAIEQAAISTSKNMVEPTATYLPSVLENLDAAPAGSNDVLPQNSTTSTETLGTALEVNVDASNSNHGTISKDAYGENAEASNKMALSNILHSQATNEENEDDDDEDEDDEDEDEDMLSELSEGGDLQVCSTVYD